MKLVDRFKNTFLFNNKYKTNSEAVIIACYFNPQRNPYRLKAFRIWYESIKHLKHEIVECVIGDSIPELINEFPSTHITRIYTKNLLWHKESLLNNIVKQLPQEYKYVFWLDTDITFTNDNWLVEAVEVLQTNNLVQPFEYCIHLEKDQTKPHFDVTHEYEYASKPNYRHPNMWKSFGANHEIGNSNNTNYDAHGHVGFAWGARREVLDAVPLYDKALVGGADHIIAHAGAGQIGHSCITKSFTEDIESVNQWSKKFYSVVQGKIGYVEGDLYHIWHGDLDKRKYLKRIQEFTPENKNIIQKDKNGLYVTDNDTYVKNYFNEREVKAGVVEKKRSIGATTTKPKMSQSEYTQKRSEYKSQYPDADDSFIESLIWGYVMDSTLMGTAMGGNIMGAMIGDMLNTDDQQHQQHQQHQQQQQDYQDMPIENKQDDIQSDSTDYTTSENFS